MTKVVSFGEIMMRLSPPGCERLLQSPTFSATFGGAEANVAVSLAHFGVESWFVTRLPRHAIGEAAIKVLRAEGVHTEAIVRGGDRVGIYFAETGAAQRPGTVIYDRAHSAVAAIEPAQIAWPRVFAGAGWFHVTGITPALGAGAAACTRTAMQAARDAGVRISVDLNFRSKLWSETDAQAVMRELVQGVDVIIANEEDLQACLGVTVAGTDVTLGRLNVDGYEAAARYVSDTFGATTVAITLRESASASDNGWSAVLWDAAARTMHQSRRYAVRLVDRIGAGDSFAAGLIFGLVTGRPPEQALQFAVAASALKQSIPGDFNRVGVEDVDRLAAGDASGRVRR